MGRGWGVELSDVNIVIGPRCWLCCMFHPLRVYNNSRYVQRLHAYGTFGGRRPLVDAISFSSVASICEMLGWSYSRDVRLLKPPGFVHFGGNLHDTDHSDGDFRARAIHTHRNLPSCSWCACPKRSDLLSSWWSKCDPYLVMVPKG